MTIYDQVENNYPMIDQSGHFKSNFKEMLLLGRNCKRYSERIFMDDLH